MNNKLINNYIYNVAYQVLTIIIPLITTPYLTRSLGSNSLGISTYVISVVTMFQTFGTLGMDTYSRREIAYVNANGGNLRTVFWELTCARGILLLLTFTLYMPYCFLNSYKLLYLIHVFNVVGFFLDASWFYIGLEDMKTVVIRNIVIKLLSTIAIFLLVKKPDDICIYALIFSLSQFFSCIVIFPSIPRYLIGYHKEKINIKKHLRPVFSLFLPQAASTIYVQCDKIMIGCLSNNIAQVSIYEKAETIIRLPLKFVTALSSVVLPRTAGLFASGQKKDIEKLLKKITGLTIMLIIPMLLGIALVADIFVPLYLGNEYYGSIIIVRILAISTIFIALSNITGVQYLMAVNETKILTVSYITAAFFNVVTNFFLIKYYNSVGAAIATVFAEGIVFAIQYCYILKNGISLHIGVNLFKSLWSLLAMSAVVILIKIVMGNTIISGIIQILSGMLIYVIMLIFSKDDTFIALIRRGKKSDVL